MNANSNDLKGILNNPMQIRTIRKGFKAFEAKFEPFQMDSKHSNANPNLNHSKGIRTIPMQILTISKGIRSIRKNLKHWVQIRTIWTLQNEPFWKHLKAASNHSKGIQGIRTQILTIWKGF